MKNYIKLLPNIITVLRIFLSILFIINIIGEFAFNKNKFIYILILFILICISDLLDGKIARKTGTTSFLGAKLDVFSDMFYIVISYITLIFLKFLPIWFLIFISIKFIEFLITSKLINNTNNFIKNPYVSDKIGKFVSIIFFIIPGVTCIIRYIVPNNEMYLLKFLLYIVVLLGIYSSYIRITNFCKIISLNDSLIKN